MPLNHDPTGGSIPPTDREAAIREILALPEIGRKRISSVAFARYDAALTHRSFVKEGGSGTDTDNERLEFLGDRVLNLVVAEFLYREFREPEGSLSARMEWTKNRNLAVVISRALPSLPRLIRLGQNQALTPGIVAGACEAFVGALYLDAGLPAARGMITSLFSASILTFPTDTNYKKRLQEQLQAEGRPAPTYEIEWRRGKPHTPLFSYRVLSGETLLGTGSGRSKSEATQMAALNGLHYLLNGPG